MLENRLIMDCNELSSLFWPFTLFFGVEFGFWNCRWHQGPIIALITNRLASMIQLKPNGTCTSASHRIASHHFKHGIKNFDVHFFLSFFARCQWTNFSIIEFSMYYIFSYVFDWLDGYARENFFRCYSIRFKEEKEGKEIKLTHTLSISCCCKKKCVLSVSDL